MPQRRVLWSLRRVTIQKTYFLGLGNNLDETIDGFSLFPYMNLNEATAKRKLSTIRWIGQCMQLYLSATTS